MTYHAASSISTSGRRWFIGKAAPATTDHSESVYGPIHTTQMTAMWFRNAAQTPVIYHIPAGAYFFQYTR